MSTLSAVLLLQCSTVVELQVYNHLCDQGGYGCSRLQVLAKVSVDVVDYKY